MKHLLEVCLATVVLVATNFALAQPSPAAADNGSFGGTWDGSVNSLPAIKLRIEQAGTNISGDVVFYFQKRDNVSRPWHVAGAATGPLLEPRSEGTTLAFEVRDHQCHSCPELGPNVKFRMALIGTSEARVSKLGEAPDSSPGLLLLRRAESAAGSAPPLQAGISVELPVTRNARALPDADEAKSSIVSIRADGASYFGMEPITPAGLVEKFKTAEFAHPGKLYVKADQRAPYSYVLRILEALEAAGLRRSSLLTAQPQAAEPKNLVPPEGLEIILDRKPSPGSETVLMELFQSVQGSPALKINHRDVPLRALEKELAPLLHSNALTPVLLKAEGQLPFACVAEVVDRSEGLGAEVVLSSEAESY